MNIQEIDVTPDGRVVDIDVAATATPGSPAPHPPAPRSPDALLAHWRAWRRERSEPWPSDVASAAAPLIALLEQHGAPLAQLRALVPLAGDGGVAVALAQRRVGFVAVELVHEVCDRMRLRLQREAKLGFRGSRPKHDGAVEYQRVYYPLFNDNLPELPKSQRLMVVRGDFLRVERSEALCNCLIDRFAFCMLPNDSKSRHEYVRKCESLLMPGSLVVLHGIVYDDDCERAEPPFQLDDDAVKRFWLSKDFQFASSELPYIKGKSCTFNKSAATEITWVLRRGSSAEATPEPEVQKMRRRNVDDEHEPLLRPYSSSRNDDDCDCCRDCCRGETCDEECCQLMCCLCYCLAIFADASNN